MKEHKILIFLYMILDVTLESYFIKGQGNLSWKSLAFIVVGELVFIHRFSMLILGDLDICSLGSYEVKCPVVQSLLLSFSVL